jgi:hypothetical protein
MMPKALKVVNPQVVHISDPPCGRTHRFRSMSDCDVSARPPSWSSMVTAPTFRPLFPLIPLHTFHGSRWRQASGVRTNDVGVGCGHCCSACSRCAGRVDVGAHEAARWRAGQKAADQCRMDQDVREHEGGRRRLPSGGTQVCRLDNCEAKGNAGAGGTLCPSFPPLSFLPFSLVPPP